MFSPQKTQSNKYLSNIPNLYVLQRFQLINFSVLLKFSRYDVRATLLDVDISQFEAPLGGYGNRLDYISSAEQEAELLAEEERYYSLFKNEVEEELYTEERKKREAAAGMSEVPFNYDTIGPKEANGEVIDSDVDDLPFIASPNLDLPADMEAVSVLMSIIHPIKLLTKFVFLYF